MPTDDKKTMTNAELIKRLRDEGSDSMRKQLSIGMWKLCHEAADALEALEARVGELELENGQLILELGNIEKNTGDTQEAIRRIAHYRRGK